MIMMMINNNSNNKATLCNFLLLLFSLFLNIAQSLCSLVYMVKRDFRYYEVSSIKASEVCQAVFRYKLHRERTKNKNWLLLSCTNQTTLPNFTACCAVGTITGTINDNCRKVTAPRCRKALHTVVINERQNLTQ